MSAWVDESRVSWGLVRREAWSAVSSSTAPESHVASHRSPGALPAHGYFPEVTRIAAILRRETVGEPLLLALVPLAAFTALLGKTVGIQGATSLVARFTRAPLDQHRRWVDITGPAMLGGIGFTVSLLIGEPAYGTGVHADPARIEILVGSFTAAVPASILLRIRIDKRARADEEADADPDGIPDIDRT